MTANMTTNMAANMAALGNISDTEVTFLEISAVIVIQPKNILCELIITCFIGTCTSQIILIIDLYMRAQRNIYRLIP